MSNCGEVSLYILWDLLKNFHYDGLILKQVVKLNNYIKPQLDHTSTASHDLIASSGNLSFSGLDSEFLTSSSSL